MPRPKGNIKSHLPADEVKICLRVREARLALGLSQQEFAGQVGIRRESLASYEDARVALKALLALQICNQFIVSERWLATGAGYFGEHESEIVPFSQPMARMYMGLIDDSDAVITSKSVPFTAAYKETLGAKYLAYWDQVGLFPRIRISPSDNIGRLRNILQYITSSWIGMGGEAQKKRLFYGLIRSGYLLADEIARGRAGTLVTSFESEIEEIGKKAYAKSPMIADLFAIENPEIGSKKELTNRQTSGSISDVKSLWQSLKQRLQSATDVAGKKSELANFLKVDLSLVSRWLGETKHAREPGAEYTLKMLRWVEQQERQK